MRERRAERDADTGNAAAATAAEAASTMALMVEVSEPFDRHRAGAGDRGIVDIGVDVGLDEVFGGRGSAGNGHAGRAADARGDRGGDRAGVDGAPSRRFGADRAGARGEGLDAADIGLLVVVDRIAGDRQRDRYRYAAAPDSDTATEAAPTPAVMFAVSDRGDGEAVGADGSLVLPPST